MFQQQLVTALILLPWLVASQAALPQWNVQWEKGESTARCRSNATHLAWSTTAAPVESTKTTTTTSLRTLNTVTCGWQTRVNAENELYQYLRRHVMQFDLPFLETLGFDDDNNDDTPLPDGLGDGMVGITVQYALRAKTELMYTDQLPYEIFREYVVNYANTNEARSNWRPLLWKKLRSLVQPDDTIDTVVRQLNTHIWTILAPADQEAIVFKSGSTPLVFDPMSILAFGYASCTGVAILLANALRTVGVPVRVAGTAAWHQERENGNHNWIEVWKDGQWHFMEPSLNPNGPIDDLSRNPCQRWFCNKAHFTNNPANTSLVYAARLESPRSTYFPLAWEWTNHDVPGEDVSALYQMQCGQC